MCNRSVVLVLRLTSLVPGSFSGYYFRVEVYKFQACCRSMNLYLLSSVLVYCYLPKAELELDPSVKCLYRTDFSAVSHRHKTPAEPECSCISKNLVAPCYFIGMF